MPLMLYQLTSKHVQYLNVAANDMKISYPLTFTTVAAGLVIANDLTLRLQADPEQTCLSDSQRL